MIRLHHCAIAIGLACFLAPSVLLARPMTERESRCFETGEAAYQSAEPSNWDGIEPAPEAEWLAETVYIDCIGESSNGPDDDIYGWENFVCR
jgi:hypothetical protein